MPAPAARPPGSLFSLLGEPGGKLVAMFQITMNESFDRPRPDGVGFLT